MPRCLSLTPHLSDAELERRYRACRDPGERSHWHIVWSGSSPRATAGRRWPA